MKEENRHMNFIACKGRKTFEHSPLNNPKRAEYIIKDQNFLRATDTRVQMPAISKQLAKSNWRLVGVPSPSNPPSARHRVFVTPIAVTKVAAWYLSKPNSRALSGKYAGGVICPDWSRKKPITYKMNCGFRQTNGSQKCLSLSIMYSVTER